MSKIKRVKEIPCELKVVRESIELQREEIEQQNGSSSVKVSHFRTRSKSVEPPSNHTLKMILETKNKIQREERMRKDNMRFIIAKKCFNGLYKYAENKFFRNESRASLSRAYRMVQGS